MSFVMNLTDNDPHLECRREIHRLRAENEQLRAERDQLLSDIREVFSDDWYLLEELKNLSRRDLLPPSAAAHRLLAISGEQK